MSAGRKVVVIGAGFGGLAAAIRLQARGFAVTLVDKRDAPGGRAYVYRDAGFAFDGGPTVVTAPFLLEELFALAGKRMEEHLTLVPVDPFYRIRFHDGRVFDYTGDGERMAAEVAKFSPGDVDGYARFVEESQKIFAVGFEQLGDVPFSRARDMLKIVPQMIKLRSHLSVWRLVCKYIKDDALRVVMSFHPLLVGGNPFTTTSIYTLIAYLERKWGVWFAKGGTGAIVQALVDLFTSLGGDARARRRRPRRSSSRAGASPACGSRGGRTLPATIVVSNADAPATYKRLLPARAAQEVHRREDRSDALFDEPVRLVLRDEEDLSRSGAPHDPARAALSRAARRHLRRKVLAPDFSLYLHAPTRTDPSLAPPGCENFYVLSPVPHLESGDDWAKRGDDYQEKIFEYLEKTCIPGLRENLVTSRFITPRPLRRRAGVGEGRGVLDPAGADAVGLLPLPQQVGGGRRALSRRRRHAPRRRLPGVLSSAKVVDRLIADVDGTGNARDPIAGTHAGALSSAA